MQKILYFSISLHIPRAWSRLFISHKITCSINANEPCAFVLRLTPSTR